MKLGFFVWEYPPWLVGGLGTYSQYITHELVDLGHDVIVFTMNPGGLKAREIVQGVEVHRPVIPDASNIFPVFVPEDMKRWGPNVKLFSDIFIYNVLSATKCVNDLVRRKGYKLDVIAVHDWLGSIGGLMVKNELGTPLTFHVHSTEWGRSGGGGLRLISRLEQTLVDRADRIVTVSNAMKDDLSKHGWPMQKIGVVWNGVDPNTYRPDKCSNEDIKAARIAYGIKAEEQMILYVGRLSGVKGVGNLIQAMPKVFSETPKAKLVILGTGDEQANIAEAAAKLKISDRVSLRFEFISEQERILHYAASDVCVFPSIYEPFGIVSLEAMAMEKPIVVGAKGVVGFREQVLTSGSEQCGLHADGRDPSDIAKGIADTLGDMDRAKKWGQNGRKRVLKHFTWRKAAEKTVQEYEKISGS